MDDAAGVISSFGAAPGGGAGNRRHRPIVIVTGMPGSGAALCARVLSALGVDLADRVADPAVGYPAGANDNGDWQRPEIAEFHHRILALFDRSADSPLHDVPLPVGWWADPRVVAVRREIAGFVAGKLGPGLFGFEAPLTARLFPMWRQIISELRLSPRVVFCLRNPGEVAHDCQLRHGLDPELAEHRWFIHTLEFFRYVDVESFCTLEFEQWGQAPLVNLRKLQQFLRLSWAPADSEAQLILSELAGCSGALAPDALRQARQPAVRLLYTLARDAEHTPAARDAIGNLIAQFASFQQLNGPQQRALAGIAGLAAGLTDELAQVKTTAAALRAHVAELEREAQQRTAAAEAIGSEASELRAALQQAEIRARDSLASAAATGSELGELRAALQRAEIRIRDSLASEETARAETEGMRRQLAETAAEAAKHRTAAEGWAKRAAELGDTLAESERLIRSQSAAGAAAQSEIQKLQAGLSIADRGDEQRGATIAANEAEITRLVDELAAASRREESHATEIAALLREIADLRARLASTERQAREGEDRAALMRAERDRLEQRLDRVERLQDTLRSAAAKQAAPLPNEQIAKPTASACDDAMPLCDPVAHDDDTADAELLLASGLFDPDYYQARYPDAAERGTTAADLVNHFIDHGARGGRDPHPLFITAYYVEAHRDIASDAAEGRLNPLKHFLLYGGFEGRKPHPLFDPKFYLDRYPDAAASQLNPLVHYVRHGCREQRICNPEARSPFDAYGQLPEENLDRTGRRRTLARSPTVSSAVPVPNLTETPSVGTNVPPNSVKNFRAFSTKGETTSSRAEQPTVVPAEIEFDAKWYLWRYPDIAAAEVDPLHHYTHVGKGEGRLPNPSADTQHRKAAYLRARVPAPDLFPLRSVAPRGRIAVVLHLFDPSLWPEMQEAIERIPYNFDLFVTLVKGYSDCIESEISNAYPFSHILTVANHGRDIGPFFLLLESGILYKYDLVCKLHGKKSPHRADGQQWRQELIKGVLGSPDLIERVVRAFDSDPDIGIVVAAGNIYQGAEHWISNCQILSELLPRIGISTDVLNRSFPGGSIFWIRSLLLRSFAGLDIRFEDFDPEPLATDGALAHAIERIFGLVCEDAGMRVVEHDKIQPKNTVLSQSGNLHTIAFYLPQYHPIPENDEWWGKGFTEWTNVTRARPLFQNHRQPRLPGELGFYDLRLDEIRERQCDLAREYDISAFCYYYYWFNGRRILERPLEQLLMNGKQDFPFLICWANEPWTRNWDGLNKDILLPQTYDPGWAKEFVRDITPILRDARYFRFAGSPVLLIYRVANIPQPEMAIKEIRLALAKQGLSEVHLAAAWAGGFHDDFVLPEDPRSLGLDAYYEFPPQSIPVQGLQPLPANLAPEFEGEIYDYNKTVDACLSMLQQDDRKNRHKGVTLGWDSTARRKLKSHIFHGATPTNFRRWLRGVVEHERRSGGERMIFINAWNEWAEGTYLEPDQTFGRGWLEAVKSALAKEQAKK